VRHRTPLAETYTAADKESVQAEQTPLAALVRAGATFSTANSSKDPMNQEVRFKRRDTPIHRS
jgi:hypothetical protein